jgi:hypothetical protein
VLTGRTAIGRTTIDVLVMNAPERVELRRLLMRAGLFPEVQLSGPFWGSRLPPQFRFLQ